MIELVSRFKEELKLQALYLVEGELDEVLSKVDDVQEICDVMKDLERENPGLPFWSELPDMDEFKDEQEELKCDVRRLRRRGLEDGEIGERMLDEYGGRRILGLEDGGDLSWKSTAERLSREKQRLEQELKRREKELLQHYREDQD